MCTSPLRIINRTTNYRTWISPFEVIVPCRECESCRMAIQNDWFLRTYFHFKDFPFCLFYTLTYSNENLPYYKDSCQANLPAVPCFNSGHIKSFLDCVRKYLIRRNIISPGEFNFIIASEYGEDPERTRRPHYHCLFFFKRRFDYRLFHDLVRQFWVSKHGFVFPDIKSKSFGSYYHSHYPSASDVIVRSGDHAARYVSKYICKDMEFFGRDDIKAILHHRYGDEFYKSSVASV